MEHNTILLRGTLQDLPIRSHENHGRKFYRFLLEVPRLSGAVDLLPVMAPLEILEQVDLTGGSLLRVEGQIRSHNFTDETGRHLQVYVHAAAITAEEGPPANEVHLSGAVCRLPTFRQTPLGRQICDLMLAVPRAFHRADYLPCILWGRLAETASCCRVSETVTIDGRLQSRIYSKTVGDQLVAHTAYEISALSAVLPDRLTP